MSLEMSVGQCDPYPSVSGLWSGFSQFVAALSNSSGKKEKAMPKTIETNWTMPLNRSLCISLGPHIFRQGRTYSMTKMPARRNSKQRQTVDLLDCLRGGSIKRSEDESKGRASSVSELLSPEEDGERKNVKILLVLFHGVGGRPYQRGCECDPFNSSAINAVLPSALPSSLYWKYEQPLLVSRVLLGNVAWNKVLLVLSSESKLAARHSRPTTPRALPRLKCCNNRREYVGLEHKALPTFAKGSTAPHN